MAKRDENTASVNEEAVSEETAAKQTVTISKEDFDALMADVKLMKQQLASEERKKSLADKALEREEAELARIEESNKRAEEIVEYMAPTGSLLSNKNLEVSINGKQYVVPRGVVVKIPRKVKEVIENAIKQRNISFGMQEKMKDDFAKQEEKQTSGGYAVTL